MTNDGPTSPAPPPSSPNRRPARELLALVLGRDVVPASGAAGDGGPGPAAGNAAGAPAPALRAQLPDAVRRAGADPVVRGAGHLPVLLLQLRPAGQLPRHRHRVPAGPVPGEPLPLGPGGAGPADPFRPGVPGRGHPDRTPAPVLRLRDVPCQRPAHVGHAARRVPGRGRRHGDDRRGRRPDVRPVPAAGRLPAGHRGQHRRHRGLLSCSRSSTPSRSSGRSSSRWSCCCSTAGESAFSRSSRSWPW